MCHTLIKEKNTEFMLWLNVWLLLNLLERWWRILENHNGLEQTAGVEEPEMRDTWPFTGPHHCWYLSPLRSQSSRDTGQGRNQEALSLNASPGIWLEEEDPDSKHRSHLSWRLRSIQDREPSGPFSGWHLLGSYWGVRCFPRAHRIYSSSPTGGVLHDNRAVFSAKYSG